MKTTARPIAIEGRRPRGLITAETSSLRERPAPAERRDFICRACGTHQDDDHRCKACGGRVFGF